MRFATHHFVIASECSEVWQSIFMDYFVVFASLTLPRNDAVICNDSSLRDLQKQVVAIHRNKFMVKS